MEKIARLCWNTNNWKCPSGLEGKSKSPQSYENLMGFGHEEWLLDNTRILPNGYHYGFIQALNTKSSIHEGKIYDIHLFTISPSSQKVYIGCLYNATVLSYKEKVSVYEYYKNKGWINEMKQDVKSCNGDTHKFSADLMFNIKFKFKEAKIHYSNQPLIEKDSLGHRYNLMDINGLPTFLKDKYGNVEYLNTDDILRKTQTSEILINPLHKKIQNAVVRILNNQYKHLYLETDSNFGQRIDIKGQPKDSDQWHFFEIKTNSTRRSIREALGQILEYAHYPKHQRADCLYIIGPEEPEIEDKQYLSTLRELYKIPVWFRWYSFEEDKLYDEI